MSASPFWKTPAWGLAFYEGETLLFTVSLCFRCSNAYVYDAAGIDRAEAAAPPH